MVVLVVDDDGRARSNGGSVKIQIVKEREDVLSGSKPLGEPVFEQEAAEVLSIAPCWLYSALKNYLSGGESVCAKLMNQGGTSGDGRTSAHGRMSFYGILLRNAS